MPDGVFSRDEIIANLDAVAELLAVQGHPPVVLVVVGGAYLAMRGSRASTGDVDLISGFDDALRVAVAEVATRRDLPLRWLNDDAAPYAPRGLTGDLCETVYERPGFRVLAPPAEFVFLMKLYRSRAPDYDDMVELWPACTFASPEEAVRRYFDAYPHAPEDPHLVEFVREIAQAAALH